jgi:hypothetical protein
MDQAWCARFRSCEWRNCLKIARYLYEYHADSYASLGLPPLPVDRSRTDVHGILEPQEVIADHFYQKYLDYLAY